jgi:hypothetical protein
MVTSKLTLFLVGMVSVCVLFVSLMLLPSLFTPILCAYMITSASILLVNVLQLYKHNYPTMDDKSRNLMLNLKHAHIFNISILSVFLLVIIIQTIIGILKSRESKF